MTGTCCNTRRQIKVRIVYPGVNRSLNVHVGMHPESGSKQHTLRRAFAHVDAHIVVILLYERGGYVMKASII